MGIKGLTKLIEEAAKGALREKTLESFFGRKVAIDASTSIYQFMVAVRQDGAMLTTETGETTSHLNGMFYRTIRLVEHGLKPVYVFDGKPPVLKSGELSKRAERRQEAMEELEKATEAGDQELQDKFSRRVVKVTPEHAAECKKLLRLMGIPTVDAPSEAEAQCAELCKSGKVFAVGSEDMDTLTFKSPVLLRNLTVSEAKKKPIMEFNHQQLLAELELTNEEFIDLCILCGCDYCDTIKGIGPVTALKLIKKHKTIEEVLANLDPKYQVPENFIYPEVRNLFLNPEVISGDQLDLKWNEPDEEGLIEFMSTEKGFNPERIRNGVKRLKESRQKGTQERLESFFGPSTLIKRKAPEASGSGAKKGKADPKGAKSPAKGAKK
eukprot:TRINITY_DN7607_c0_g1_i1.p1 TRINITY_DN7607_c0_g1~~TRINITY_DN7607_c0_g1_i1.p1  ORF type:complete len:381 (-),score=93.03 TRINITY_DN7607_c0_g1_i1:317-1459(-)